MVELTSGLGPDLCLTSRYWELMRRDVDGKAPEEACGFLAGKGQSVSAVIPVTNKLHSPFRYHMDPYEQLQAFQRIEEDGQELLGIYHSHPNGPDVPSPTDIAEAFYPDVVYIIWYRALQEWRCRAFRIKDGSVSEVGFEITDG